ncbi:MAG TPA: hypothetical protein VHP56_11310 [Solirubrobacterales bacterium]|jgi:hypothetical protein|nr:hypothetical protein [Solirubrobacterales bacterium]
MVALCALTAGALFAFASGGKGGKPSLSGLEARFTGSGTGVVVSGYATNADSVLARYGKNCRILRHGAIAGNGRFRASVPRGASRRRASQCNRAVAKRVHGRKASTSTSALGKGKSGAVRVIACAEGKCAERRVALARSVGASSPGLVGGGRVTVAPGVTVRVPTAPPVPPSQPATRFVAPGGSDSGSCSSAASPCKTFNRAYEVANPGEVVDVAGGTYPSQAVEYDSGKTSAEDVYFRPAAGNSVKVGDIDAYGSHVTFMAMQAADTDIPYDGPADVSDVTFWGMDGRNFTIDSGTQINVLGGDYGPATDCGGSYGGSNNGIRMNREGVMPSDILIWGVDMHDIQSYDLEQCHIECLIVGAGQNITVRGSRFWNCSIFDIFLQPFNGTISDVTLENNWFATPTGTDGAPNSGRAVEFSGGGPWRNILIRHNSVNTAINLNDGAPDPTYENTRVIGNIAERAIACYNGVVYRDNVWWGGSGTCDPSDSGTGGGPPFVHVSDHGDLDYHLTGGVAVDKVPASISDLVDDIDGQPRPDGPALDAGSDER